MSKAEILAELPRLDYRERREIARALFDIEADAQTLVDCDLPASVLTFDTFPRKLSG
jgi:hypothetical protein